MGSLILSRRDLGRNDHSSPLTATSSHQVAGNGSKLNGASLALRTPVFVESPKQVVTGSAGDHYATHQLLLSVFHAPSPAEFQAQLDEPQYEPNQRLLIKEAGRVVAHLRLVPREMRFGSTVLPVCGITELATASECRSRGYASALLVAAEQQMKADSAELGFVRTTARQLFERQGWMVWGRHSFSTAGTREVLAQLSLEEEARPVPTMFGAPECKREPLSTRIWRHVEQAALVRLYEANTKQAYGPLVRSNDNWHWLVCRHGYEQIYVVVEGRDRLDLDESGLVGYAITRPGRIVELMIDPARPNALGPLLTRICGDFIERDLHSVRFDGPPNDPLHRLFVKAGGEFRNRESENQQWLMAKVFDMNRLFDLLSPQILDRARLANVSLPFELGIHCGDQKWQLSVTKKSIKLSAGKLGRNYLRCEPNDFAQLLLGHSHPAVAATDTRLTFSTRPAAEFTAALFPYLPIWRPPFDELPA